MLVISRRIGERIKIGDDIEILIVDINKSQVKLGIEAPKEVPILREELLEEIKKQNIKSNEDVDIKELQKFIKGMK
jgi:carbon storage regulator